MKERLKDPFLWAGVSGLLYQAIKETQKVISYPPSNGWCFFVYYKTHI
ncbi:hypothetical protein P4S95_18235 [Aneurinibacillus aneurinilyticus]|nr:hypothetical protein [Aneurinibacillus aneurinilyticus]